nr:MAG TPA: protein of unknown function (DUF4364) [Caudoviricetes sp.]
MFLIRTKAIEILADIYEHCDSNLRMKPFHNEKYTDDIGDFIKCIRYLQQSGFIERTQSLTPDYVVITAKGIDRAEDYIIQQG